MKRAAALDLTVTSLAYLTVTRRASKVITEEPSIVMIFQYNKCPKYFETIQDIKALFIAR